MQDVDILIEHGLILTMDNHDTMYQDGMVAIRGDSILYVGNNQDNKFRANKVISAKGCLVMPGLINCHTHAPLYDHVKLYKLDYAGPLWNVRDMELFQDGFPADGTLTGTVRCDIALDIAPSGSPNIVPGDSVVVNVSDRNYGLGLDPTYGRAAVYLQQLS